VTHLGNDSGNELGYYLRSRRERVSPDDAGLPSGNSRRRTPGLRREEVATLAGVSIDYYTKLERGRERHPSGAVLDALAAVLRLNGPERAGRADKPHTPDPKSSRPTRPCLPCSSNWCRSVRPRG